MTHIRRIFTSVAGVAILAAASLAAPPASPASQPVRHFGTLNQWALANTKAALDLAETGDFEAAYAASMKVFDTLVAYGSEKNEAAFREASCALRLISVLSDVEHNTEILKFLRKNPRLGHTLAFLIRPENDEQGVFKVLAKLREKHEAQLETYASLTAALCVVHDKEKPFTRRINENSATSADPVALFEYYVKNEKSMYFGIKSVPAELLIWVVDTTSPIEHLTWALQKYANDPAVGKRFFDIKYDDDAFLKGTPKKVTVAGFSLPNILKYGGVCADQAYFALEVGKAIGVPTAYASGASATTSHAWVGFLQARGKQGWWNFDEGRYSAYKGIRGWVMDPQTRERVPDNDVSLSAELIGTSDADRETAVALTDAASRLGLFLTKDKAFAPEMPAESYVDMKKRPSAVTADRVLEMLDFALKKNAAYSRAWLTVAALASNEKMTLDQKKTWSTLVLKLCGTKYPDFAIDVLEPMIGTVTDVKEQDRLWTTAFNLFSARQDLAAEIRMAQAEMWSTHGDSNQAGQCYMDVITRYADAGPFVLPALKGAEKMLKDTGKENKIVTLYSDAWKRTTRPKEMAGEFMTQSNWYRVGTMLASKMRDAGDDKNAAAVSAKLESAAGTGK